MGIEDPQWVRDAKNKTMSTENQKVVRGAKEKPCAERMFWAQQIFS